MNGPFSPPPSRLRQRLIEDMEVRGFSRTTQRNYMRDVARFATFLGRPPDTATAEDVRRFQVEVRAAGSNRGLMAALCWGLLGWIWAVFAGRRRLGWLGTSAHTMVL